MPDQPSFWEQNNLLGLLIPPVQPKQAADQPAGDHPAALQPPLLDPQNSPQAPSLHPGSLPAAAGPNVDPDVYPDAVGDPTEAPAGGNTPKPLALPAFPSSGPRSRSRTPQLLLILDTETTGLSPVDGQCIEVGAVLFHVPSRSVLTQVSFLLPCRANPAEPINGIAAEITRLEQPWSQALQCFMAMVAAADAVLAHNAAFDRQWFGLGALPHLERPWICSMEDIRWPAERQLKATPSVRDLALAYGVPVWAAHRALTDCIYLAQVLERCAELEALLEAAMVPRRLYRAQLPYAERQRAKQAGFRWNEPVAGAWSRRLSQAEAEALPFPVLPVETEAAAVVLPRSA